MEYYFKVLKNYANVDGRARRSEYWYFVLFSSVINITLLFVDDAMSNKFHIIRGVYSTAVFLPSIAVGVRRMHDVAKSGWYILIPFYNFVLAVTEGDKGSNEYGPDPKEEEVM